MRAWRAIPFKWLAVTPIAQNVQSAQEDYSEFMHCLLDAAERALGEEAINNKDKILNEMIQMCSEADPFVNKVSQMVHLVTRITFNQAANKAYFKCGKKGYLLGPALSHSFSLLSAGLGIQPDQTLPLPLEAFQFTLKHPKFCYSIEIWKVASLA